MNESKPPAHILIWRVLMNESKPSSHLLIVGILGTIVGIVTGLIGVWVPAIYIDNLGPPGGGAGATLAAMFLCSPAILVLGLAFGLAGIFMAEIVCGRYDNKIPYFLVGIISAAIAGFMIGVLPFILLFLLSWATAIPL